MSRNRRILKWICSFLLGLCAAFFFTFTFLNAVMITRFQWIFAFIYLVGFFTLIVYSLLWTAIDRLAAAGYSPRSRITWLVGALLAGFLLFLMLPVATPNLFVENQTLEIIATGEKNPQSNGAEVWLSGVQLPDGEQLELKDFKQLGDWRTGERQHGSDWGLSGQAALAGRANRRI